MIELPEAVVLARQIERTLAGRCVVKAVANQSPHKFAWYSGDPARYQDLLAGKNIRSAVAYGNHVEIHAGDRLLVINTPMRYHPQGEMPAKKHQLLLEFDDHSTVTCTVQMWGGLFCFAEGEQGGMPDYRIAMQKPSPLSKEFDRAYFDCLFDENTGGLSAKAFLATEQRIPGLGNGVLQDILWRARIHPKRKMAGLSGGEISGMFEAVKSILAEMTAQGGRDTELDLFDHPGGYKTVLSKKTAGTPFPVCGSIILKEAYMGGSIYVCQSCQKINGE